MTILRRLLPLFVTFLAPSCNSGDGAESHESFPVDAVATEDLRIGVIDGSGDYVLGRVVDVVADSHGRIYVADASVSRIRVYDPNGTFLRNVGGPGPGPGEFGSLVHMVLGPDGRLYVDDAIRLTVFREDPRTGFLDLLDDTRPLSRSPTYVDRGAKVDRNGGYHYPVYWYGMDVPPRYFYLRFPVASPTGWDTIPVPAYEGIDRTRGAYYIESRGGMAYTGRIVEGMSAAPFEPVPVWDVTPRGTILGGSGDDYVLIETNSAGDSIGSITIARERRVIGRAVAQDSLAALKARLATIPVSLAELHHASPLAVEGRLPEYLPSFVDIRVLADGRIVVELPTTMPGSRLFEFLAPDGSSLHTIEVQAPFSTAHRLFFADNAIYGVAVDEVTNVEFVVRASYE